MTVRCSTEESIDNARSQEDGRRHTYCRFRLFTHLQGHQDLVSVLQISSMVLGVSSMRLFNCWPMLPYSQGRELDRHGKATQIVGTPCQHGLCNGVYIDWTQKLLGPKVHVPKDDPSEILLPVPAVDRGRTRQASSS